MLRLHAHPLSPYGRKAWSAMLHRGDQFELAEVKLGVGWLRRPEFLAISPFGKMPVLETPDGPIIESTSIIEWLEVNEGSQLIPESRREAFLTRHFDRLGDLYLIAPMAKLWWEKDSEDARAAPATVYAAWLLFEERLDGRHFLVGDEFTLADIGGAIATDYLQRLGLMPPERIAKWCERVFTIPAMKQARDAAEPWVEKMLPR